MEYNFDDIIGDIERTGIKRIKNNIYLSNEQIDILKRYGIDCYKYNDISQLIFDIEEILNEEIYEDLESVSIALQEFNYYNNTNK